ncbi:hypothetical protein CLCR_01765 [Cladophialophora carrionii]|uniref:Uncharacterized protein n=1 Tax=Cladophialophora carrionii TaxID=86049 RepID=A0A1C1CBE4_9EURO|nr:hypothetical protein CLCR_01765 [Cladophialophora carrionii]
MSGCNGARSLIGVTTSRCLRPCSTSQLRPDATRQFQRHLSRNASSLALFRRHQYELNVKKDQIRSYIRALEMGRRRFSTSPVQSHGHIDPPKPGEE